MSSLTKCHKVRINGDHIEFPVRTAFEICSFLHPHESEVIEFQRIFECSWIKVYHDTASRNDEGGIGWNEGAIRESIINLRISAHQHFEIKVRIMGFVVESNQRTNANWINPL